MKLVAFLQLYNENETGNLRRCLDNCKKWADEIFIYDDCSIDGSQEVYLEYTDKDHIIFGTTRNFTEELFHKQQLLELTLKSNPDWIGWIDGDTTLSRTLTENCKQILEELPKNNLHSYEGWFRELAEEEDDNPGIEIVFK